jgi:para-aminobenzoate synthetase component 2
MRIAGTVVLIDNYDSFTYNLSQYIRAFAESVKVVRNDKITIEEIARCAPSHLVISPGPKDPSAAGISVEAVRQLGTAIPILGVCLGHQCINEAFGGRTIRALRVVHGKTSNVQVDGRTIYRGLPRAFRAARYHSLVVDPDRLGAGLEVSAWSDDGSIMGLRHTRLPVEGVQFHPESFLTEHGMDLMRNYFCYYAQRTRPW